MTAQVDTAIRLVNGWLRRELAAKKELTHLKDRVARSSFDKMSQSKRDRLLRRIEKMTAAVAGLTEKRMQAEALVGSRKRLGATAEMVREALRRKENDAE